MLKRMFCFLFLLSITGLFIAITSSVYGQKIPANSKPLNTEDNIVKKYKDLSSLPTLERKNFFRNVSASDRSELWRVHLAVYIAQHPNMENQQKELISEAISLFTPEFFEESGKNSLQPLVIRATEVFPKAEMFKLFGDLGGGNEEIKILEKYQSFAEISPSKIKKAFREVSTKDRSELWRIHLALQFAKRPEMTGQQKELLMDVISFLTPEVYRIVESNSKTKETINSSLETFVARTLVLFSKEKAAEIFTNLGSKQECINNFGYDIPEMPDCNCHRGFGDMCSNGCIGTGCRSGSWGCGFGWVFSCNGTECSPG